MAQLSPQQKVGYGSSYVSQSKTTEDNLKSADLFAIDALFRHLEEMPHLLKAASNEESQKRNILDMFKIENFQLRQQMHLKEKELKNAQFEIKKKEADLVELKEKSQDAIYQYMQQITKLNNEMTELAVTNEKAQQCNTAVHVMRAGDHNNSKLQFLEKESLELKQQLYKTQEQLRHTREDLEKMKTRFKKAMSERTGTNSHYKEPAETNNAETVSVLKCQLHRAAEQVKTLKEELDVTKTRLSKAVSDRLTDNNPNIADLSDKNRPTKLQERYCELYDNEWTDAFEAINEIYSNEKRTIKELLKLLFMTEKYCYSKSKEQMNKLLEAVSLISNLDGDKIPVSIWKTLKDCRKVTAEETGKHLYPEFCKYLEQVVLVAKQEQPIALFLKECFKICWLMAIQDPPVVLRNTDRKGDVFNADLFKPYTKSGSKIEFIVWPPLLLYDGGPVLCKGVAQGSKDIRQLNVSAHSKFHSIRSYPAPGQRTH